MNRSFHVALILGCVVSPIPRVSAATITAQLFPLTGEIRLQTFSPVSFVYYSISSASGALNNSGNVWKSITNTYDAPVGSTPGNGFIDSTGEWLKLSTTRNQLAEGALGILGGNLAAQRSVSLGAIWNPHAVPLPDLAFDIRDKNGQPVGVSIQLAIDGDYNGGRTVDQSDYSLWRQYFGSTTVLLADGNINGRIDAADYVVWRNNRNKTLPLPPFGFGRGGVLSAIPEPSTLLLTIAALAALRLRRR